MIIGAAVVELTVHGSHSLKEKRGVVRSVKQRVRNRFNLSVAEIGGQNSWQRAVLGMTTVGHDPVELRKVLERAVAFVEQTHLAEVSDSDIEILTLDLTQGHELGDFELDDSGAEDADEAEAEEPAEHEGV